MNNSKRETARRDSATQCTGLGRYVARVIEQLEWVQMDYDMDGSGECGRAIHRSHAAFAERVAREAGFVTYDDFLSEVEARTSARYVHFSGLAYFLR